MSEFRLSDGVDKGKTFLINYSSLDNRYDPKFYHKNFTDNIDRIKNNNYSKLNDVIEFSSETWNQKDYFEDTFPYIEISKINTLTGIIEEIKKVEKCKAPSRAKMIVRNNDIIISTTRPDRGAISYVKTNDILIASTGFSILRDIKNNIITKKYLFYILKLPLVLQQFNQRSSGGNYPAITQEEISKVIIPIPTKPIQQNIIDMMDKAYLSKKQKEKQAKELLESIDTYLLDELGITLPEVDNSLDKRIFEVNLSDVSGGRFDPFYYKYCVNVMKSIKYEELDLIELANINKGQSITSKDIVEGKYPVIGGGQTSPYNHNKCNHDDNIITVSASGAYAGYVWYHNYAIFASDCNVLQSKNEEECKTVFLFNVLKLKQQELYNLQQGSGQPHVYADDIKNIKIPLPPIKKQNEIAEHIQNIRDEAKQLKLEAVQELESAKAEVEKMILGL